MNKSTTKQAKSNVFGQVVHRLPGRVRVRIDRLRNDINYGEDLKQAVSALRGVTEVRINNLASSIVINYHSSELPEQNVLDCLGVSFLNPDVAKRPEHPATDRSDPSREREFVAEAEKLTAEIASEVVGETVGEILLGPLGAEIGAKIGDKVDELLPHERGATTDSAAENPPPAGEDLSQGQEQIDSQKLPPLVNPLPNRPSQSTPKPKK